MDKVEPLVACKTHGYIDPLLGKDQHRVLQPGFPRLHPIPASGPGHDSKLPGVNVALAARSLARRACIGRSAAAQSILLRRAVATVASRFGVSAGERPRAVIDARGVPTTLGMTLGAPSRAHFVGELTAMRVVVTVGARRGGKL